MNVGDSRAVYCKGHSAISAGEQEKSEPAVEGAPVAQMSVKAIKAVRIHIS